MTSSDNNCMLLALSCAVNAGNYRVFRDLDLTAGERMAEVHAVTSPACILPPAVDLLSMLY